MWSLRAPDLLQFNAGTTFHATRPQAPETSVLTNGNHLGFLCREVIWSDLMSKPFWLESAGQTGKGKTRVGEASEETVQELRPPEDASWEGWGLACHGCGMGSL